MVGWYMSTEKAMKNTATDKRQLISAGYDYILQTLQIDSSVFTSQYLLSIFQAVKRL